MGESAKLESSDISSEPRRLNSPNLREVAIPRAPTPVSAKTDCGCEELELMISGTGREPIRGFDSSRTFVSILVGDGDTL